jgi:hypothetical protein
LYETGISTQQITTCYWYQQEIRTNWKRNDCLVIWQAILPNRENNVIIGNVAVIGNSVSIRARFSGDSAGFEITAYYTYSWGKGSGKSNTGLYNAL